jgi:hypothetical protein
MAMVDDPYKRLGIQSNASHEAIRRAYRAQAKRLHPDLGGNAGEMARLAEAYAIVSRPVAAGVAVFRAPRRAPRRVGACVRWSPEAERFAHEVFRPQARLLELTLERLDLALAAGRRVDEVVGQAELAVAMAGSRLARATWPAELERAKALVGKALRLMSDGLVELGEDRHAGRKALDVGRFRLRTALAEAP